MRTGNGEKQLFVLDWRKWPDVNELPSNVDGVSSLCACRPGLMTSDQFSPDSAALQSILQNEGVKVQASVCPSGRNTSVYTVCQQIIVYFYIHTSFARH